MHALPINDIDHAWTQDVDVKTPFGMQHMTVYFGRCTCGEVFSALDSSDVTREWMRHKNAS